MSSGFDFDAGFALEPPAPGRALDPTRRYDVLILGAGPAGICAAVYLLRKGLGVGVIAQSLGGQVAWTAAIENYLGYRLIDGAGLVRRFQEQLGEFPADLGLDLEVTGVEARGEEFAVRAGNAVFTGRALLLATGKRPRLLGVPGESRLIGRGVAFCAVCDAPLYRGKVVAVVGGGNSGLEAAIDLSAIAPAVHLLESGSRLTGDPALVNRLARLDNVQVSLATEVVEILGEERVHGVRVRALPGGAARELPVDGVFVEIGLVPNSDPFRGLVPLNERGEVVVDCACRTAVAGIFAAGDVTSVPYKQIVIAAGEGAKAALSAYDYLMRR